MKSWCSIAVVVNTPLPPVHILTQLRAHSVRRSPCQYRAEPSESPVITCGGFCASGKPVYFSRHALSASESGIGTSLESS